MDEVKQAMLRNSMMAHKAFIRNMSREDLELFALVQTVAVSVMSGLHDVPEVAVQGLVGMALTRAGMTGEEINNVKDVSQRTLDQFKAEMEKLGRAN